MTFYAQSWGEGNSFLGRVLHHAWYGICTKKVQNWFYVRTKKIHKWKDKSSQLNLLAHDFFFSSKDNFSKELHINSVYFYIKHKIKSLKRQWIQRVKVDFGFVNLDFYVTLEFWSTHLFLWGHKFASSFRLFRLQNSFLQMMMNFS